MGNKKIDEEFELCQKAEHMLNKTFELETGKENKKSSYIRYVIKPKVKFRDLINNGFDEAIKGVFVELEFNNQFKEEDIEITIKINKKVIAVLNSQSGESDIKALF